MRTKGALELQDIQRSSTYKEGAQVKTLPNIT